MVKAKAFIYKNYTFHPVGNILGGLYEKLKNINYSYKLDISDYDWDDFYKVAKRNHANCDVFNVNGKLYIPTSGGIIGITTTAKIKYIDEYVRMYH